MTPDTTPNTLAQHRITRLATQLPVHRAFHWLHLHQPQLLQWQLQMLAIPAPPFAEQARAAWFLERFTELGLSNPHIDFEGNAIAQLTSPAQSVSSSSPADAASALPLPHILLSAHLDTVFPPGTPTTPTLDETRILGPGACDNAAGLTALLAIAAALRYANITPPIPILFCANVGEEGEGNLRGMRHLFTQPPFAGNIAAALALEGAGTFAVVTRALGSRRFRITIAGPGGHSWSDSASPNPILLVARALTHLAALPVLAAESPRTTLSPGQVAGGISINSIPASATVQLDLRSTDSTVLDTLAEEVRQTFQSLVAATPGLTLEIAPLGHRPAATLPDESPLLQSLRAVDRHLGLRTELRLGSTDANLPLSLGIPACAMAAGGSGGGIHTLNEWYDPTGRETALRRILLTLLDLTQSVAP